ncbi:MAG: SBBP repeat-containing protein [Promethearchaeota archaeon]
MKFSSQVLVFLLLILLIVGNLSPIFLLRNTEKVSSQEIQGVKQGTFPDAMEKINSNSGVELPKELPFSGFIENKGQIEDVSVLYYYSSSDMSVGFSTSKITFVSTIQNETTPICFSLTFSEANLVTPEGKGKKNHPTNFYYGNLHLINVPSWDEIWYYDLYPQIDLRYYMTMEGLKYDFIVRPGGNPAYITVQVNGAVTLDVQEQKVIIKSANIAKTLTFYDTKLQVFQADKIPVSAKFVFKHQSPQSYGFLIGQFDSNQLLIIDPRWISFSTFLGGENDDTGRGIAVDDTGNVYIAGSTASMDFPIYNAYDATFEGEFNVFVTKLNATGELVFSTFLGGSSNDFSDAIDVDDFGNCYITGHTHSTDFPIYNAYQSTLNGSYEVFVTKLNATGTAIVYSTFLGGYRDDIGNGLAVDNSGNVSITGLTDSTNFPTYNAINDTKGGTEGTTDVFVTKLNATGNGLIYSTYLSGNETDRAATIAVDDSGDVYIAGIACSPDFPILNAYQNNNHHGDVFVTKLNATGNIVFSTFLGGDGYEIAMDIAIDTDNNCYITGSTASTDFPTHNAIQDSINSTNMQDMFVTKLNTTGNGLVFSTYFGGTEFDGGSGISVDSLGNCYICGATSSASLPTHNAYQSNLHGHSDAFMMQLNATGTGFIFSTYFGGNSGDCFIDIAIDDAGNIYTTGDTDSPDFPIRNACQSNNGGDYDVLVVKFSATSDDISPTISSVDQSPSSANVTNYDNITITAEVSDDLAIQAVTLYYSNNESTWQTISMTGTPYQAVIGPFPGNTTLRYYIQASDWANNFVISHIGAPANYSEVNILDYSLEITTTPAALNVTEYYLFSYDFNASFIYPSSLTWMLSGNCTAWLTINNSTGEVTGTPPYISAGVWNLTVIVTAENVVSDIYTVILTSEPIPLFFSEVTPSQPSLLYDIIDLTVRVVTNTSIPAEDVAVEWWLDETLLGSIITNSTGYSSWVLQLNTSGTHHVEVKVPTRLYTDIYLPTTSLEFWFNGNASEPTPVWLTLGDEYTINGQLVDEDGNPVPDVALTFIMNNISLSSLQTDPNGWMNSTQAFLTVNTYKVTVLKNGIELSTGENIAKLFVHVVTSSPVVTVISPNTTITETVVGKAVTYVGWVYFNETPPIAVAGVRIGLLVNGTQVDSLFSDSNGKVYFNYAFVDSGIYRVAFYYNEQSWGEIWVTVTAGYFASWTGPSTAKGTAGQELEFTIYVLSNTSTLHRSVTLILNNGIPVIGAEIEWYINDAYQNSTVTGVDGRASFKYVFATLGFYRVVAKHEGQTLATFEVFISEAPKEWLEKFLEDNSMLFLVLVVIIICFMVIGAIPPVRRQVAKSYRKVKTLVGRKTIFGPRYCARVITAELEEKFGREELHDATIDPASQEAIKREVSAKLTRFPEFMTKTVDEKVEFTQKTTELILKRFKK